MKKAIPNRNHKPKAKLQAAHETIQVSQNYEAQKEFTPEEKMEIEREKSFAMYLFKTKQAKVVGKDLIVNDVHNGNIDQKLSEISPEHRKILFGKYEKELEEILEFIVMGQMQLEKIDAMDQSYYGNLTPVKTAIKVLHKALAGPIEKDYAVVHKNGKKNPDEMNEANKVIKNMEYLVKSISSQSIPAKEVLSIMVKAHNYESETMLATAHRIIKKHEK